MRYKEDLRLFRMIPLAKRNWAAMLLAAMLLLLCATAAVLLWAMAPGSDGPYVWLTAAVMTLASLVALFALITGDVAWFLLSVIVSRLR